MFAATSWCALGRSRDLAFRSRVSLSNGMFDPRTPVVATYPCSYPTQNQDVHEQARMLPNSEVQKGELSSVGNSVNHSDGRELVRTSVHRPLEA